MTDCLCRIAALTDWLKVLITSEPLPELSHVFESSHSSTATSFNLNQVDAEEDIITYTRSRLEIFVKSLGLDGKWLADEPVHELARKAAGLFIWTNTVMEFIRVQRRRDAAMESIISGTGGDGSSLDVLYKMHSRVQKAVQGTLKNWLS